MWTYASSPSNSSRFLCLLKNAAALFLTNRASLLLKPDTSGGMKSLVEMAWLGGARVGFFICCPPLLFEEEVVEETEEARVKRAVVLAAEIEYGFGFGFGFGERMWSGRFWGGEDVFLEEVEVERTGGETREEGLMLLRRWAGMADGPRCCCRPPLKLKPPGKWEVMSSGLGLRLEPGKLI